MHSNHVNKTLKTQEKLCRQYAPLLREMEVIGNINRHQELIRVAFGALEDMRVNASLIQASQLREELVQMQDQMLTIERQFRLPEFAESTRLLHEFANSMALNKGMASNMAKRLWKENSVLQHGIETAMKSINRPWLSTVNEFGSINGFAGLQSIGYALRTMRAFDSHLTDALRIDLGDWRKRIIWPPQIFSDPLARSSFYVERGLNPDLTAFPNNAFEQIVTSAGLERTVPLDVSYDFKPKLKETEIEADFKRTNKAHDLLQRFETQIRKFIDERMTAAFGTNWTKHRIPSTIRDQWLEKRQRAIDNGEKEWPLIAYADFTDYVQIITRKDNWLDVFKGIFGRKNSVQESFQRLYPIRICTMHARLITQDDELYLSVEMKRILAAIGS